MPKRSHQSSLNVPSRLKGIETICFNRVPLLHLDESECAFPFEGN